MESSSPSPFPSKNKFPSNGFIFVMVIFVAFVLGLPFYTPVNQWLRRKFRKCCSLISSCLRICECGSEEANERGADAQERIELNDLVIDQLDIPPQQNRDNLGPHRGRQQFPFELRDLQNNLIEFRPDGGHLRDPLPELPIGMREFENNLINLHPDGIGEEIRVNELPEILVELRNNLDNLPNGDQEHSL